MTEKALAMEDFRRYNAKHPNKGPITKTRAPSYTADTPYSRKLTEERAIRKMREKLVADFRRIVYELSDETILKAIKKEK